MKELLSLCSILVCLTCINAQQNTSKDSVEKIEKTSIDSLKEASLVTQKTIDELKKISITGFIQMQYQSASSDGIDSYEGGNFSPGMHNRFLIKRGQVKFVYSNELTRFVFQIEANTKNIYLKDAYAYLQDPWIKIFALKVGVYDRPFGFEISYSSAKRESPERSRLFQSLFPNDGDLGVSIEMMPKEGLLSYLNLKGGLFAGNGINPEVDNQMDFIGRLGVHYPLSGINSELDLGISTYLGKVKKPIGKSIYSVNSPMICSANTIDDWADRNYLGYDLEFNSVLPLLGNFSIRAEYISGKQPGFSSASSSSPTALPVDNLYLRNFAGYYFIYIQNLGDKNKFVIKYDSYDPNTDVDGNQIGQYQAARLGAGDIKYSTFALGWIYSWDSNIKFISYYDIVKNETSINLAGYESNISDNVFTLRLQYSF